MPIVGIFMGLLEFLWDGWQILIVVVWKLRGEEIKKAVVSVVKWLMIKGVRHFLALWGS